MESVVGGGSQPRAPSTLGMTSEGPSHHCLCAAPRSGRNFTVVFRHTLISNHPGFGSEKPERPNNPKHFKFCGFDIQCDGDKGGDSEEAGVPRVGCGIWVCLRKGSEPSIKFCWLKDLPQVTLVGF